MLSWPGGAFCGSVTVMASRGLEQRQGLGDRLCRRRKGGGRQRSGVGPRCPRPRRRLLRLEIVRVITADPAGSAHGSMTMFGAQPAT